MTTTSKRSPLGGSTVQSMAAHTMAWSSTSTITSLELLLLLAITGINQDVHLTQAHLWTAKPTLNKTLLRTWVMLRLLSNGNWFTNLATSDLTTASTAQIAQLLNNAAQPTSALSAAIRQLTLRTMILRQTLSESTRPSHSSKSQRETQTIP